MATKTSRKTIENYLEAMKHPLREKVWVYLYEHGVSSPKEIAGALGETIPNVSHHTKRLVELDCAEPVRRRQVRGAVEHFYRAVRPVLINDEGWNDLRDNWPALADWKLATFMQSQLDDFRAAVDAGTLGRDDHFLISRIPVVVDEQGRDELLELLLRVEQEKVVEIVQRSKERRAKSGADGISMSVLLSGLKTPLQ